MSSGNYSSNYFDEEICHEEKRSTTMYIASLAVMETIAVYFFVSLILSLKHSSPSLARPENQSFCRLQYTTILRGLLLAVIANICLRQAIDLLQLALGSVAYKAFGGIFITKTCISTLTNACVYAFLWLRQWLLYNQPILREVKTTTFKVFNIALLFLIVSLVAVAPALEVRYVMLELTEEGCMLAFAQKWGIVLAIYTAFSIAYETVLLGFFIYPLKKTHSQSDSKDKATVLPIVKRSMMSATACFLNEILFTAIHLFIERPVMLNTISTDLKHLVYYISLVSSYNDWLEKFCLPCIIRSKASSSKVGTETRYSTEDLDTKSHDNVP